MPNQKYLSKKTQGAKEKQVADFIIKTELMKKEDRLNNLRSPTFTNNNIEKNVKDANCI